MVQRGTEGATSFGHGGADVTRPRSKIGHSAYMLGSVRVAEPVEDSLLEAHKSERQYVIHMDTVSVLPDAA